MALEAILKLIAFRTPSTLGEGFQYVGTTAHTRRGPRQRADEPTRLDLEQLQAEVRAALHVPRHDQFCVRSESQDRAEPAVSGERTE